MFKLLGALFDLVFEFKGVFLDRLLGAFDALRHLVEVLGEDTYLVIDIKIFFGMVELLKLPFGKLFDFFREVIDGGNDMFGCHHDSDEDREQNKEEHDPRVKLERLDGR